MNLADIRKRLDRAIASGEYCAIDRNIEDSETIDCFVLGVGKECVLIQNVEDFHLDGYSIILVANIKSIYMNKFDRFRRSIMKKEGVLDNHGIEYDVDLTSIKESLRSLKQKRKLLIVALEKPEDDGFAIGKILRLNKHTMAFRAFNGLGRWEDGHLRAEYTAITRIGFDQEYIEFYSRHLRE